MAHDYILEVTVYEGFKTRRFTYVIPSNTSEDFEKTAEELVRKRQADLCAEFPYSPPLVKGMLYRREHIKEIDGSKFLHPDPAPPSA